ncbi:hypothetical protein BCR34DRAFT_591946 [Clohesyomyces aquaticus]|uniref:Uncharacterized protein n=1 Tax=Clohesyomyces aquaticus TaxID=1231657 RepID=A0A1Y1YWP8_9PLEO|nr:hypothetical protein BCR34DRAFT_591946 [Clohesyomyces aquaticus]
MDSGRILGAGRSLSVGIGGASETGQMSVLGIEGRLSKVLGWLGFPCLSPQPWGCSAVQRWLHGCGAQEKAGSEARNRGQQVGCTAEWWGRWYQRLKRRNSWDRRSHSAEAAAFGFGDDMRGACRARHWSNQGRGLAHGRRRSLLGEELHWMAVGGGAASCCGSPWQQTSRGCGAAAFDDTGLSSSRPTFASRRGKCADSKCDRGSSAVLAGKSQSIQGEGVADGDGDGGRSEALGGRSDQVVRRGGRAASGSYEEKRRGRGVDDDTHTRWETRAQGRRSVAVTAWRAAAASEAEKRDGQDAALRGQ